MPSRIYSTFPERKITNPNPPPGPKAGTVGSMSQKQGYCHAGLPGKPSNAFAKAKAGTREVNGYAAYEGLSSGKNWIAGAIKHPGALTKKAKKAGESPMEFAHENMHATGKTGKQARLAMTLSKMHK